MPKQIRKEGTFNTSQAPIPLKSRTLSPLKNIFEPNFLFSRVSRFYLRINKFINVFGTSLIIGRVEPKLAKKGTTVAYTLLQKQKSYICQGGG